MSKMILIDEATVKLALEALDRHQSIVGLTNNKQDVEAIIALRKTLTEQPAQQQEPVLRRIMQRLADLLDEDHFAEIESIVAGAGVTPPAQQQEPVAFSQFLSDVVTAAGLLSHGKTDKSLAARISEFALRLRTSPQPAQQEPVAEVKAKMTGGAA